MSSIHFISLPVEASQAPVPILLSPLRLMVVSAAILLMGWGGGVFHSAYLPRLSARPWLRLLMRTKPVMGPSSPSFSMLRLARASSPVDNR